MSGRAPQRYDVLKVDMSWHERAACRGQDVPPEWFSAVDPVLDGSQRWRSVPRIHKALQVCGGCPVVDLCRQQAIDDRDAQGVWGGSYFSPRRSLLGHVHGSARPDLQDGRCGVRRRTLG